MNEQDSKYSKLDVNDILQVVFYPQIRPRTKAPAGSQNMDIEVEPGVTIGGRLWIADKADPIILFFHGNGEIVTDYDDVGPMFPGQSLNFLIVDFRGYGWSDGQPTVTNMMKDSISIYTKMKDWFAVQGFTGPLFLMGRSLGSASALEVMATYNDEIKGLIIESGFAETVPLAKTLEFDVENSGLGEEDGFRNLQKIEKVTKPTFILHGQLDNLIPLFHAQKLHASCSARSKELQIIPGAEHNTMIAIGGQLYFEAIGTFIKKVSGINTWRDRRKRYKKGGAGE